MNPSFTGLDAQLYDDRVHDWAGEIDFYRPFVERAAANEQAVLEIACGTGRVTRQLAQSGARITGMDLSPEMLDVAQKKSHGLSNMKWVQGNMRSFALEEQFGLVIIPGHSFQFMHTPEDQVACLRAIQRHLTPNGVLILHLDHQDVVWLGEVSTAQAGVFEMGKQLIHPQSGRPIRTSFAWTYERSTQTATSYQVWEELDASSDVVNRWEWEPKPLHCAFRSEIDHVLARVGFANAAVYGDFYRQPLRDDSSEMIWVAEYR